MQGSDAGRSHGWGPACFPLSQVLLVCRVDKKKLLSRCSQCNSADIAKVDRDAIQHVVNAKVFNYVTRFWQCQECKKVFWVGPKSDAAVQNMLSLVLDGQDSQQQAQPVNAR